MLGVGREMNCDLRCRKATVMVEQMRKLVQYALIRPKVFLLLNIGYGLFIQMEAKDV